MSFSFLTFVSEIFSHINVVYKIGVWSTVRVGKTSGNCLPPFLNFFSMIRHMGKPSKVCYGQQIGTRSFPDRALKRVGWKGTREIWVLR